jgi:hypothetical protein
LKTVTHRSNGVWDALADEFCFKVNTDIPSANIISIAATLGNYDDSGIFIAYGSALPVNPARLNK